MKGNQKSHNNLTENSKKNYELKRKRRFVQSWKPQFVGLSDTNAGMVCTNL